MKKGIVALSVFVITLLTSCLSNPGGNSNGRYEVYPVLRNGVVIMADKSTGELFRAKLSKDGKTTWESLGSPADAK